jgi:hypothetical protein
MEGLTIVLKRTTTELEVDRVLSRQDWVLQSLAERGLTVTSRMLSYWRSNGSIGNAVREGNDYLMRQEDIDKLEELIRLRELEKEALFEHEGHSVVRVEFLKLDGQIKQVLHTAEGGKFIKEITADDFEGRING